MTVNIMAILAVIYAIMAYMAFLDGNWLGVAAILCIMAACAYLEWETRLVKK